MLDKIAPSVFTALIGKRLRLAWQNGETELEVAQVSNLPSNTPREIAPFSLLLRSREKWQGPQGLYALHVPEVGVLELFVVPTGPDADGLCYEVIFN